MEKLNLQNNNLNPRLYVYSKYAFSTGYFLLILSTFLLYIGSYKNLIPLNNLIITDIAIAIIAAVLFITFIFLRFDLHKKSKYKLTSKDKKWYILTSIMVVISFIIVIVWLSLLKKINSDEFLITWIISLIAIVLFSFLSSILEYLARFNEFATVATVFELQAKENDLIIAKQYAAENITAEEIFNEGEAVKEEEVPND